MSIELATEETNRGGTAVFLRTGAEKYWRQAKLYWSTVDKGGTQYIGIGPLEVIWTDRKKWTAHWRRRDFYWTLKRGRTLYHEEYIGGEPYKGDDEQYWKLRSYGWGIGRGSRIMTSDWIRIRFGIGYIHWRSARAWTFSLTRRYWDLNVNNRNRWHGE